MSDRELLELAAKAAGYEFRWDQFKDGAGYARAREPGGGAAFPIWAPINDDGDNRRLQVTLRLGLVPTEGGGWDAVRYDAESCAETVLASDADPRMAVLRAAAEIGRGMG